MDHGLTAHAARAAALSEDELICIRLLADGQPIELADRLRPGLSDRFDAQIRAAVGKLGARNALHAVSLATLAGVIGQDVIGPPRHEMIELLRLS